MLELISADGNMILLFIQLSGFKLVRDVWGFVF